MANQHFSARFVDAPIAIDHKNAERRIGCASSLRASRLSTLQDLLILHGATTNRTTGSPPEGLIVGYFHDARFDEARPADFQGHS
jgi:hypothetical protein